MENPQQVDQTPDQQVVIQPDIPSTDAQDASEWDDAAKDLFPGFTPPSEEEKKDEASADTSPKEASGQGDDQVPSSEVKDEQPAQVAADPDPAIELRATQRASEEEVAAIRSDIRQSLFREVKTELFDKDGDPIREASDLMKLVNPRTGEAFTADEAAVAFVEMKQHLRDQEAQMNSQVDIVTKENVRLKDESNMVMQKYGEVLKANPEVAKALWDQYRATLVIHVVKDASGKDVPIILKAPVSAYAFFSTALNPYIQASGALVKAEQAAEEAKKVTQARARSDRADIYGSRVSDNKSEEDKEWDEAASAVFGNQLT